MQLVETFSRKATQKTASNKRVRKGRIYHDTGKRITFSKACKSLLQEPPVEITEEVVRGQEPARICWLVEKFCEISPHESRHVDLMMVLTSVRDLLRRSRGRKRQGV